MRELIIWSVIVAVIYPVATYLIYYLLKKRWQREDAEYIENMSEYSYTMKPRKTRAATDIATIFFATNFILWPFLLNFDNAWSMVIFTSFSFAIIIPLLVQSYIYSNWRVAVDGDVITLYVPFHQNRALRFDEILYATKPATMAYPRFRIYIRNEDDKIVNAFSVGKHIIGFNQFIEKMISLDKISEYDGKLYYLNLGLKFLVSMFVTVSLIATGVALFFIFSSHYDFVSIERPYNFLFFLRSYDHEHLVGLFASIVVMISTAIGAILVMVIGKQKIEKWKQDMGARHGVSSSV